MTPRVERALGLDRPLPLVRAVIADEIDRLIAMLDGMDADPDLEPSLAGDDNVPDDRESDIADEPHDDEHDSRHAADGEPSLGWPEQIDQERRNVLAGDFCHDDGEEDCGDMDAEFFGGCVLVAA